MPAKRGALGFMYVALFVLLAYIAFQVVRPFLIALIAGAIAAYLFFPIHKRLVPLVRSRTASAIITTLLVIIIILVPSFFVVQTATGEARVAYIKAKQLLLSANPLGLECGFPSQLVCQTIDQARAWLQNPEVRQYVQDALIKATTVIVQKSSEIILGLPRLFLAVAVALFVTFFALRDGESLVQKLKRLVPMSARHQEHILSRIKGTVFAVMYGSIVVALVQGALGGIGFYFVGISNPVFWGIVMAVFALVPFIGTAVVWLPAGIYLMVSGYGTLNNTEWWQGIGLIIYGALVVSTVDNMLKPKIIGERSGLHPILVFVGALGGIALFGIMGFVLGPLVLALFQAMIEIYEQERVGT